MRTLRRSDGQQLSQARPRTTGELPPVSVWKTRGSLGDVAQLVERLLCKQEVDGSIPFVSTE